MPQLHLQKDSRIGKANDPVAVKTTLGWVLMGGKNTVNKINTNRLVTNENINLDQQLEQFWAMVHIQLKLPKLCLTKKKEEH